MTWVNLVLDLTFILGKSVGIVDISIAYLIYIFSCNDVHLWYQSHCEDFLETDLTVHELKYRNSHRVYAMISSHIYRIP
jgi:hypothetical protein